MRDMQGAVTVIRSRPSRGRSRGWLEWFSALARQAQKFVLYDEDRVEILKTAAETVIISDAAAEYDWAPPPGNQSLGSPGHTQTLQRQIGCMHEIDSNRKRQRGGPGLGKGGRGPDLPDAQHLGYSRAEHDPGLVRRAESRAGDPHRWLDAGGWSAPGIS